MKIVKDDTLSRNFNIFVLNQQTNHEQKQKMTTKIFRQETINDRIFENMQEQMND